MCGCGRCAMRPTARRRPDQAALVKTARMKLRTAVALAAASAASVQAFACSPAIDNRSYVELLGAERLAFVGTVMAVQGRKVTFEVGHVFAGSVQGKATVDAAEPSTCAIAFQVGQRWIYGGNYTTSPSVLLETNGSGPLSDGAGRLRRSDDERLVLPAAWQACRASSECVIVPAGCSYTAANKARAAEVARKAVSIVGDHRAMECARRQDVLDLGSQCVASRCGSWFVDLSIRP
jgi:hypothetical protein